MLARFDQAADDEIARARAARAAGRRAIGLLAPQIPAELVRAAGAEPILLWPRFEGANGGADEYFEYFFPVALRVWFEQAIDGALDEFDLLVVPRNSEFFTKFYLYLREVQRQEPQRRIPKLHLFDLLLTPGEAIRRHNRKEIVRLFERICALQGTAPSEGGLRSALTQAAQLNAVAQSFQRKARGAAPLVSGVDALRVLRGMRALDPAALGPAMAGLELQQARPGCRLLLLGADLPSPSLLAALEDGATIVAEEHGWGGRCFEAAADPAAADPFDALAQHLRAAVPAPRSFDPTRDEAWIRAQAPNVDAAVFVIPSTDDSYGWDYPARRDLCHALGLRSLLLRPDDRHPEQIDRAAIAAFLAGN